MYWSRDIEPKASLVVPVPRSTARRSIVESEIGLWHNWSLKDSFLVPSLSLSVVSGLFHLLLIRYSVEQVPLILFLALVCPPLLCFEVALKDSMILLFQPRKRQGLVAYWIRLEPLGLRQRELVPRETVMREPQKRSCHEPLRICREENHTKTWYGRNVHWSRTHINIEAQEIQSGPGRRASWVPSTVYVRTTCTQFWNIEFGLFFLLEKRWCLPNTFVFSQP